MLHGHAPKESSRKLQNPNLLKTKNCFNTGPWNIYFLSLNHIIFRLHGSVCKLFFRVGVNNSKEEKLTYPTAKYVWAGKIRFSRLICVSEKAKIALKLKTGIKISNKYCNSNLQLQKASQFSVIIIVGVFFSPPIGKQLPWGKKIVMHFCE